MDILAKIDVLFEQEFRVHTEPVKSALLQTVGQVIKDIWSDSRYSKYDNLSDEQLVNLVGQDSAKLIKNAKICKDKCNTELNNAKRATSSNIEDLKTAGIKSGHIAAMVTPGKANKTIPPSKLALAAAEILRLILYYAANTPGISTSALIKNVKQAIKGRTNIPEVEINKIIAIISQDENTFSKFMDDAAKEGAEAAAEKLGPVVGAKG